MNDIVHLSRTNPSIVARQEGARSVFSSPMLAPGLKSRFWFYNSKNHALWYRHAVILNSSTSYQWADCHQRCKGFVRSLPIAVTERYRDRSGERLDFYIQETLTNG